jgi:hypothetical protein
MALSELIRKLTHIDDVRRVKEVVNLLIDGHHAAQGTVTLGNAPDTTTTVTDARCGVHSKISLMPITSDAAADVASIWVTNVANGSFVINHPADAASYGSELVEDGDMAAGDFTAWTKLGTDQTNLVMTAGVCRCGSADDGDPTGVGQTETLAATTTYCYSFEISNYSRQGGAGSAEGTMEFGNPSDGGIATTDLTGNGTYTGEWTTVTGGAGGFFAIMGPGGINSTMDLDNVSITTCTGAETRTFHYIMGG